MKAALRRLNRRLNADAYDLLCAEIVRLHAENETLCCENETLRSQLAWAEDCAERWREDAVSALNGQAEATGGTVGLTLSGHVMVVGGTQHG